MIIKKTIFREEHSDVTVSCINFGNVYQALGQYNEAKKEYYDKALIIGEKPIFGEGHGDIALSYNNFGIVYQALGQHNEAT